MRTTLLLGLLAVANVSCVSAASSVKPGSSSVTLPPKGEWLSLQLKGQHIGYTHSSLSAGTYEGLEVHVSVDELMMSGSNGRMSTRFEKAYDPAPPGRLLGFRLVEGRDERIDTWEGTCTPDSLIVIHKRSGAPDERLRLPPCRETVAAAVLGHLAARQRATVESRVRLTATDEKPSRARFVEDTVVQTDQGPVKAAKVEWDEGVHFIAADGRTLKIEYGVGLSAVLTSETEAKSPGKPDLAALAGLRLSRPFPERIEKAPASVVLLVSHFPEAEVRTVERRQEVQRLPDGRLRVTVSSHVPGRAPIDPAWRNDQASAPTLQVDAAHPSIVAFARKAAGGETDAWTLAHRLGRAVSAAVAFRAGVDGGKASEILARGVGTRPDQVVLYLALARAMGLPAREATGLVAVDDRMYPAIWAEVFVGEWISVDPNEPAVLAPPNRIAVRRGEAWFAEFLKGELRVEVLEP